MSTQSSHVKQSGDFGLEAKHAVSFDVLPVDVRISDEAGVIVAA